MSCEGACRGRKTTAHRLEIHLRYLWALVRRFKVTFLLLLAVLIGGTLAFWVGYEEDGHSISLPKALSATFFLLMGQPSLSLTDSWALTAVQTLLPLMGLAVLADGLVRFVFLFFARQRKDKEWVAVQAMAMKGHVVLCGAGRVGFRVLEQLRKLGVDVVVVERNENAPFVQAIRNQGVPILIDDVRDPKALEATNIRLACAVICATDDDLANLNIALDARRVNPTVRVVMRLFDDDLVAKVRESFGLEAMSTSALAAPAFAVAALHRNVHTSFDLYGQTMVVWDQTVSRELAGWTIARVQDEKGMTILRLRGRKAKSTDVLAEGDMVVVQSPIEEYRSHLAKGEK